MKSKSASFWSSSITLKDNPSAANLRYLVVHGTIHLIFVEGIAAMDLARSFVFFVYELYNK